MVLPRILLRFVEGFSLLLLLLMKLMRKGEKFISNEEQEKSFEELKSLGCVLMQHGKVIAYASRKLKTYEIEPNLILRIKEAQKEDGELWFVLENLKEVVLTETHNSPFSIHHGSTKMHRDLKQNFWWNGMKHDVARFIASA
ncbi:retrotransposon protein, putative, ty3-gypsy subclass [Tanacetum coccineum]